MCVLVTWLVSDYSVVLTHAFPQCVLGLAPALRILNRTSTVETDGCVTHLLSKSKNREVVTVCKVKIHTFPTNVWFIWFCLLKPYHSVCFSLWVNMTFTLLVREHSLTWSFVPRWSISVWASWRKIRTQSMKNRLMCWKRARWTYKLSAVSIRTYANIQGFFCLFVFLCKSIQKV